MSSLKSFFLLVCFFPFILSAQTNKEDSLRNRLKSEAQDTNRVWTLYTLANTVQDYTEALKLSEEGISLATKLNYKRGIVALSVLKGNALAGLQKTDEAIAVYESGLKTANEIGYTKQVGVLSNHLGNLMRAKGNTTEALVYYKQAVVADSIARLAAFESEAYRTLGEIYTSLGEHTLAMQNYLHAIDVAEAGNETVQLGYAYMMLGADQQYQKDYPKALENYKKGQAAMEKANSIYGIAGAQLSIANIYFLTNDYENALANYKATKKIADQAVEAKAPGAEVMVAKINADIGNVYLQEGKYDEALGVYQDAMTVFISNGDYNSLGGIYSNLGNAYSGKGMYTEAKNYFDKALETSRQYKLNNWLHDSYSGLSGMYFKMGNYKDAYLYKDSAARMDSIIVGQEHERLSKEMEARYENRKNEAEIAHLNEVNKEKDEIQKQQTELAEKRKTILIAVSGGLVLVLLLAFFLLKSNSDKKKANEKLGVQNKVIAEKNKDITDSITYALRIQRSVLPDEKILQRNVNDYFILNKPRDIVSGDFYWFAQKGDDVYIALADCTGHGVPGALVSVVGINLLNQIINLPGNPSPSQLLGQLHVMMIQALNKDSGSRESNDGMDIAILCINKKENKAVFAGASRPVYYSDKNGFNYFRGDRYSIAGEKKETDPPFTQQEIILKSETNFYLTSDGFADQFGEASGKKYLSKRFQELLQSVSSLPMEEQKKKIEADFNAWKGKLDQVDDVLVLGVRVG
jgi:tetratricopeptide (TPR) repeat protein